MKFLKFLIALLLLPTVVFTCIEVCAILWKVLSTVSLIISFISGIGIYTLIHYLVFDFSRMYVFMHELTHAICAFLCGYHVQDMSVKEHSGYVKMDKSNVFVALAPYFVPGYVILTVLVYLITDLFIDLTAYRQVFLFFIGFFTAFHFIQTFHTLFEVEQPDLKLAGGKFFSVVIIVLTNLLVLAFVLKGLCPEIVLLKTAAKKVALSSLHFWQILVNYILEYFINK